jgi:hypothetical protein
MIIIGIGVMRFISKFLMYIAQYYINWLNLIDHTVNCLLLGDPNETLSARIARARLAGHTWAIYMCTFLTSGLKMMTFGKYTRDHCTYALDPLALPNCAEIWSWTTDRINPTPITEINDIEVSVITNTVTQTIIIKPSDD